MAAITITNDGLNMIRDSFDIAGIVSLISYVALGTSNTAPTVNDHQLGAEVFRKKVTAYTNGASNGEILVNMYLAPGDLVGTTIQEVGFFAGGANANPNTGILLAHGLYSHTKQNTESIQFQLDLTV